MKEKLVLYWEPIGGIAGDMIVASLIELGASLDKLKQGLQDLPLPEVEIDTEKVSRHAIYGTRFIVRNISTKAPSEQAPETHLHSRYEYGDEVLSRKEHGDEDHNGKEHDGREHTDKDHANPHPSEVRPHHPHSHTHHQEKHSHHQEGHAHHHQTHRSYQNIRQLIEGSRLVLGVKDRALRIFQALAKAEAEVHGMSIDTVTFHEVGAWDSVADIICCAVALEELNITTIYCAPVPLGGGMVRSAHGVLPVPAPATLSLLKGLQVRHSHEDYEQTTPTGAAVLSALATNAPDMLQGIPTQIGWGAGTHDGDNTPNLLRAVLYQPHANLVPDNANLPADGSLSALAPTTADRSSSLQSAILQEPTLQFPSLQDPNLQVPILSGLIQEQAECMQTNVDDCNPQWLGYLMDRLFEAGALDVSFIPQTMKKQRPGILIEVIYPPALRKALAQLLLAETPTLGVRYLPVTRLILPRHMQLVSTPYGNIEGKVAELSFLTSAESPKGVRRFVPEFEHCRRAAIEHGVPLWQVSQAAQHAFQKEEHERLPSAEDAAE